MRCHKRDGEGYGSRRDAYERYKRKHNRYEDVDETYKRQHRRYKDEDHNSNRADMMIAMMIGMGPTDLKADIKRVYYEMVRKFSYISENV